MRKLYELLVVILLFTFLFVPTSQVAQAQTPTPTPTPAASPGPTSSPAPSPAPSPTLPASGPAQQGLFGVVKTVSTAALTIDTRGERGESREIQVAITSQTRIMAPPVQAASVSLIQTGNRVAVLASVSGASLTALQIVVIPAQPVKKHIQGLVMEVNAPRVTLIDRDGKVLTAQLAQGLAAPAVGQFIVAAVEEDPASRQLRIVAFEVSDKLLERLEKHIGKIESKGRGNEDEERQKGKDLERLEDILNRNADRHLEVLQRVLDQVPAQAKAALTRVLERARDKKDEIKAKIEDRRGKDRGRDGGRPTVPPPSPPGKQGQPDTGPGKNGAPGKSEGKVGTR